LADVLEVAQARWADSVLFAGEVLQASEALLRLLQVESDFELEWLVQVDLLDGEHLEQLRIHQRRFLVADDAHSAVAKDAADICSQVHKQLPLVGELVVEDEADCQFEFVLRLRRELDVLAALRNLLLKLKNQLIEGQLLKDPAQFGGRHLRPPLRENELPFLQVHIDVCYVVRKEWAEREKGVRDNLGS